jgi:4-amino-4-deoxy-L-arabinose transferase-like glycosyltransferase
VRRGPYTALLVAAAARILPLLFGFEHYGDAPVRIEVAERWARAPHLWHGFAETYQYGPLHLTLIGALIRLFGDRVVAARSLSFVAGLACVWLIYAIADRVRGPEAAWWAALGLALSPLFIQASTTGASEAPFLALFLAALLCLLDDRALLAAVLLSAAGLIRYDGWMYVPLFAALLFWQDYQDETPGARSLAFARAAGFCALCAAPVLFWLRLNARYTGDALAPIHHIDRDHAMLAQMMRGYLGELRWRLYGLVYWPIAVLGVATPVLGALALWGTARTLRRRQPGWELAAIGWLPVVYFTFRTSVLGNFRPLARFAMVAAALSLPFAHDVLLSVARPLRRPLLYACIALLVATPLVFAGLSWRRDGTAAEWARPLSPIGSIPPGLADAAQFLRKEVRPDDVVLLDGVWDYLDIPLAFAVDLRERQWVRAAWADEFDDRLRRVTPTMAVLIYQGKLGDYTQDTFDFRSLRFCKLARFSWATVYRRCP